MKRLKLNKFTKDGKNYTVCLGNGTCNRFTSIASAKQYLAQTNDFLYDELYRINKLYSETFSLYREFWCYFENDKNKEAGDLFRADLFCRTTLHEIENSLDLCVKRSDGKNGNYFAFKHLSNAVASLKQILRELKELIANKSIAHEFTGISDLYDRCLTRENKLSNYGQNPDVKLFQVSLHDLEKLEKEYTPNFLEYKPKLRAV